MQCSVLEDPWQQMFVAGIKYTFRSIQTSGLVLYTVLDKDPAPAEDGRHAKDEWQGQKYYTFCWWIYVKYTGPYSPTRKNLELIRD
jgi:hypothetical protein